MNELAITLVGLLAGLVLLQALPAFVFGSRLRSLSSQTMPDQPLPQAAVFLCLRGPDPFLADCLHALLAQDYPHYTLQLIIDHPHDPARQIVSQVLEQTQAAHVQVSFLKTRHKTCSLKCSALVQGISELDQADEVVAFVDADAIVHPTWLRELVLPLLDEQVGGTTGNRWYMAQSEQWGSLIRYIWNAPAVVSMYMYQSLWGGSMALKRSVFRQSRLLDIWTQSLSDDVPVRQVLQEMGLTVKFVPTAIMLNREECSLAQCLRFVTRQLLVTRLYHSYWILIVGQIFATTLTLVLAGGLLITTLIVGSLNATAWVLGGLAGYILLMGLLLAFLDYSVGRVISPNQSMPRLSAWTVVKIGAAIPLTQFVYALTALSAIRSRSMKWRDITYHVEGPWQIRLQEYCPYLLANQPAYSKESL